MVNTQQLDSNPNSTAYCATKYILSLGFLLSEMQTTGVSIS